MNAKILTARRGYLFPQDGIRLTTLVTPPFVNALRAGFNFQIASVSSPLPTFGPVPHTNPPGLVFQNGNLQIQDRLVPIRFLNIEQRRIVIDAPVTTSDVEMIGQAVLELLGRYPAADGGPVLETPQRVQDYSELIIQLPRPLDALVGQPMRSVFEILSEVLVDKVPRDLRISIQGTLLGAGEEYDGDLAGGQFHPAKWLLTPRVGTRSDEELYFSAAPVDTETHKRYLTRLTEELKAVTTPKRRAARGRQ